MGAFSLLAKYFATTRSALSTGRTTEPTLRSPVRIRSQRRRHYPSRVRPPARSILDEEYFDDLAGDVPIDPQRALELVDQRVLATTQTAVRQCEVYRERKGRGAQLRRYGVRACGQYGWQTMVGNEIQGTCRHAGRRFHARFEYPSAGGQYLVQPARFFRPQNAIDGRASNQDGDNSVRARQFQRRFVMHSVITR